VKTTAKRGKGKGRNRILDFRIREPNHQAASKWIKARTLPAERQTLQYGFFIKNEIPQESGIYWLNQWAIRLFHRLTVAHPCALYETKPEKGYQIALALAPSCRVRDSHGDDLPRFGVQFFPAQNFELLARA
jgi:hypothetical protein